jgi:hypothetical protein
MITNTDYETIRPLLIDGDIILVRSGKGFTDTLIKFWTASPYYHAAVVFSATTANGIKRWFVVEQHTGGQRIINLSAYNDYDVFRTHIDFNKFGQALIDNAGFVDYAYGDLISTDVREKFGIKVPNFNGEVCSGMVASYLVSAGIRMPVLISPQGLYNELCDKLIFKVRPDSGENAKPRLLMPKPQC